jgi:hypothetical protein
MPQILHAARHARRSTRLFRWQALIASALASGSLTAAMLNLGGVMAVALIRSTRTRVTTIRGSADHAA